MTRQKFLWHCFLVFCTPLLAMIVLFTYKARTVMLRQRTQTAQNTLNKLNAELKILEAEYSYQTTPTKIEQLLRNNLGVKQSPINAGYTRNIEQLKGFFAVRQDNYQRDIKQTIKLNFNSDTSNSSDDTENNDGILLFIPKEF